MFPVNYVFSTTITFSLRYLASMYAINFAALGFKSSLHMRETNCCLSRNMYKCKPVLCALVQVKSTKRFSNIGEYDLLGRINAPDIVPIIVVDILATDGLVVAILMQIL